MKAARTFWYSDGGGGGGGSVSFFLFFLTSLGLVALGAGDQALFFDEPNYQGNSLTLSISGGCYKFKKAWTNRVSSVQMKQDGCLLAFAEDDCGGQSVRLTPDFRDSRNLADADFDKKMKSASLCFEISFRSADYFERRLKPTEYSGSNGNNDFRLSQAERQSLEINLYDEPDFEGSIFTVTMSSSGDCYTFKRKWSNRVSSLEPQENCLILFERQDCNGNSVQVNPDSEELRNLGRVGFDKRTQSMRLCSQPKEIVNDENGDKDDGYQFRNKNDENKNDNGGSSPSQMPKMEEDSGEVSDQELVEVVLKEHNKYRRIHRVPDLKWDTKLQKTAQKHADSLARTNKFQHSTDNDFGENLAGISTEGRMDALLQGIQLWYNEVKQYNFNSPGHTVGGLKAGHFTQVVWKSTTHVGLGMAWNARRKWWVIVGNYNPPGNFKGDYENNVLRPVARLIRG